MNTPTNDPTRAGQIAATPRTLDPDGRFTVYPVHTRHIPGVMGDKVAWMVMDGKLADSCGRPTLRAFGWSRREALAQHRRLSA